jgi:hypothetical protein
MKLSREFDEVTSVAEIAVQRVKVGLPIAMVRASMMLAILLHPYGLDTNIPSLICFVIGLIHTAVNPMFEM